MTTQQIENPAAEYPHFGSITFAVFNCNTYEQRKGREAVLLKFGQAGWAKVKPAIKNGVMGVFNRPPIPETKLYAETIGRMADARWSKEKARLAQ